MAINEKYRMFTNFLYNEMGITKEDIKEWTKEAVTIVAKDYVENQFSNKDFNERVYQIIRDTRYMGSQGLDYRITKEVAELIATQLNITLK